MSRIETWQLSDIYVTQESPEREYDANATKSHRTFKWGQLKLLTVELLWLMTEYIAGVQMTVICAGVVHGQHFKCLVEMLPSNVRFECWDPKPDFAIPNGTYSNVVFYNEALTPQRALTEYGNTKYLYFLSDIRSVGFNSFENKWRRERDISIEAIVGNPATYINNDLLQLTDDQIASIKNGTVKFTSIQSDIIKPVYRVALTKEESQLLSAAYESEIWENDSKLQRDILEAMNGKDGNVYSALLKFRLPYPTSGIMSVDYLDGYILKQPFAGLDSTECRLIPIKHDRSYATRTYSTTQMERKMFYHNTAIRADLPGTSVKLWQEPITRSIELEDNGQLVNSFDTIYLMHVLSLYCKFANIQDGPLAVWHWIQVTMSSDDKLHDITKGRYSVATIRNTTPIQPNDQKRIKIQF